MKKTKRLLSLLALLMAALMLFSSCAISYKKADPGEYVRLAEGFDFKNFKLDAKVDKMVVTDADVTEHINRLLFELKEPVKDGGGKPLVNQPGAYNKYDILTIRTILYDNAGNRVTHDFDLDSKNPTAEDNTLTLNTEKALYLGYGDGINTDLLAALEKAMYLSPEGDLLFQNHHVVYNNIGGVEGGKLDAMPALGLVTYSSSYIGTSGTSVQGSGKASSATLLHFEKMAADIAKDGVGKDDYEEAIYLGLKELVTRMAETENQVTPSATKDLTIRVYPKEKGVPSDAKFETNATAIAYDLDFGGTAAPDEGTIVLKLRGALSFYYEPEKSEGEGEEPSVDNVTPKAAFVTKYTYPEDATGTYKVKELDENGKLTEKTKDLKNTECSVYVYVVERAPYTRPDYNAETVKSKLGFNTDKTEDAEVKAAYEASIKTELQEKCDILAKNAAKEALRDALLAKTNLIKDPVRNIKNFERQVIDEAKSIYYGNGYDTKKNTAGEYVYDDFEDYLVTVYFPTYYPQTDENGKLNNPKSQKEIENILYAMGRDLVKLNLLTYYIADALNCRYTDDELLAMAKERGAAWAKEQIALAREEIVSYYTVENFETVYSSDTDKKELLNRYGATSFEDCLAKMLAEADASYKDGEIKTWEDYAKAMYPDDAITWEDYVEYMQGEENLFGTYHYERIIEQVYQLNVGNLVYEETPYDNRAVEA